MLPTRKSVPRSSRQLDHTKTFRQSCSGMVMFPVHQARPKPSRKAQWKGEEDKEDRGRGGKTTLGNGQAWSSASPSGQWRTGKNGEKKWLQNHLWYPNDPRAWGIDDDDDDDDQGYIIGILTTSLIITIIIKFSWLIDLRAYYCQKLNIVSLTTSSQWCLFVSQG